MKHVLRKRWMVALALALLALSFWVGRESMETHLETEPYQAAFAENITFLEDGTTVPLSDLMPFSWGKVYLLRGDDTAEMRDALPVAAPAPDGQAYLLFERLGTNVEPYPVELEGEDYRFDVSALEAEEGEIPAYFNSWMSDGCMMCTLATEENGRRLLTLVWVTVDS